MVSNLSENKCTPEIRFAGFTDPWEQRKLGDLLGYEQPQKYIVDVDEYSDRHKIPVLTAGKSLVLGYTNETHNIKNASKVKPSIIFDDFTTSVHFIEFPFKVKSSAMKLLCPYNDMTDSRFCFCLLRSINYIPVNHERHWISTFSVMDINACSYNEQHKIGSMFSNIDTLITLHQRKLDKLKDVKQSLLEKMFPSEGESVPEIRFNGFTDSWEQRKFSELYKKSSEKNDGSLDVDRNISVASMQFKPNIRVSTKDYLKTYYTFNLGDIAFEGHQNKDFRFGRFVANSIGDGIVSHIFTVFRPIADYDLNFWKYEINNENVMQNILSRSTKSSTMMHDLVIEDFLNESISVPSIVEQGLIGQCFYSLDTLITLHQRKLDKLKEVKESLLEKMFV